jgi:probable HAF family extracellular repeat protein
MFKTSKSCKTGLRHVCVMFMLSCLLLPCVVLAGLAQTQTPYTITDLGTLGNYASVGTGINASGQVTGYVTLGQYGPTHAFIYTSGANPPMVDIGLLPNGTFSQGMGINASGQVAGTADTANGTIIRAFRYDPQTQELTDLGSLGGTSAFSYGSAINDSGWVTGYSDAPNSMHHAFLYDPQTQQMTDIDPFGGSYSAGQRINASGQVTGWGDTPPPIYDHAFIYTPGGNPLITDLGTLLGGTISQGYGINASGQVTGWADTGGVLHAFLYSGGTMTDLDPQGTLSQGLAINASGQVVGNFLSGTRAFLYSPGKGMIDLNELLPSGSSWQFLSNALSINDSGQITGYGQINGETHAFLLAPSEPITQPLSPNGGTAPFVFGNNVYNIVFDYPAGYIPNDGHTYTLTVTPLQTSQAAWAQRTLTSYTGTQLAPVFGLGGDGIIYRAVCVNDVGDPCPVRSDVFYTITTSWREQPGTYSNPGFLKAEIGSNAWENVFVSYSATRTDGGPDPTGSGKACCRFSDWAFVYGVTEASPATITITTPANRATYALNQAVNADYTCGNSASCIGDVAVGSAIDTASAGAKTFTVLATVTSGQSASQTVNYTVVTGPLAGLSPASVSFGNVYLGLPALQVVTLANVGNAAMSVGKVQVSGGNDNDDFIPLSLCPATLAAGKSCRILVTFMADGDDYSPTTTLSVNDNAFDSPQTVPLSATVINPRASLSSWSLNFGKQKIGTTSAPQTVTVTNTGTTSLILSSLTVSGDFALGSGTTCVNGGTLVAGANCAISVTFTPTAKGTRSGKVTIKDNALIGQQLVLLSGTGI